MVIQESISISFSKIEVNYNDFDTANKILIHSAWVMIWLLLNPFIGLARPALGASFFFFYLCFPSFY